MVRRKFNFKFSNLLHMSKGCIFIGNLMDNVSIALGYDYVNFRCIPVLIIAHVSPEIPESHGPFSMAQKSSSLTDYGNRLPWKPHLIVGQLILFALSIT